MLKMYIDNEEVVSKNDFTIKEEMLSASSTILNNTYPKSWEDDKDYISRFYYPKDYSKLILNKDTYYPHIDGETIEGSNFQIQADTTLEDSYYFEGNTIQDGTPTPTNPQEIQVVTGNQEIEVCGKNLWGGFSSDVSRNHNSVDFVNKADGTITASGTASNGAFSIQASVAVSNNHYITLVAGTYILTGGINANKYLEVYDTSGNRKTLDTGSGGTFTLTSSTDVFVRAYINSGQSTGLTFYPMIRLSSITDNTYEPYIGNTYSINLGKNLLKPKYETFTMATVTCTYTKDGLLLNGTPTANASVYLFDDPLPVGNYIINGVAGASSSSYQMVIYKNGSIVKYLTTTNYAFEVKEGDLYAFRFYIYSAYGQFDNLVLPYQIEKGGVVTPYTPYFTPIELNKIGNYQDRIFKSSGKNLFDKDTTTFKDGYYINDSGTEASNSSVSYTTTFTDVEPNTEYTLSGTLGANGYVRVYYYDSSKTFISRTGSNNSPMTFTTPNNCYYIQIQGQKNNYNINTIMLNEGSTPLPYEPYGTNKWYLYKEIGKVVLDGNTTPTSVNTTLTNTTRFFASISENGLNNSPLLYCNRLTGTTSAYNQDVEGIYVSTNLLVLRINKSLVGTTASTIKTWLGSNNIICYYPLATPICTEITNTTLINELESIELIDGLNNISITSANLSMIMNLHYNFQTEHTDSELIFSGMVKNTNNISLNPREPKYCSLEVLDNKTLLSEGKTLDYVISNKTILEAITMVVNSISEYGFELGNVNILNGDEIIGAYSTENKTAYDVLQYLADISGAKWNCRRKDNTNMYIDFYDPTLMPRGKQIEYTNEWACENNLCDIKFNYGTRDYRNKQIILSDEVEGSIEYNDRVVSDGINKEYTLPYKIASLNKIEIDGVEQSIATKEEKEVGIYADFYYSRDTDTITSNKLLPYGTIIDVSYTPIIKGREVVQNDNEIDRLSNQLEVNGTISRYENRNDTTDSNKLINIGETYLKYKGEAEITLTIKTFNNNLYNVGQVVYFNAPIPELQKDYLVKSKQIQVISSDEDELNIFYTFTLSSSFNAEKEINWFDNQRAKTEGNIGEGEFISRNIDINNRANIIWDNLRVEEVDLPVGASNDLQASLEAPLIH